MEIPQDPSLAPVDEDSILVFDPTLEEQVVRPNGDRSSLSSIEDSLLDKATELSHLGRWCIGCKEEANSEQVGKDLRVHSTVLDGRLGDEPRFAAVGKHHGSHGCLCGVEEVLPGRTRFEDDALRARKAVQVVDQLSVSRTELFLTDLTALGIQGRCHDALSVYVQSDEGLTQLGLHGAPRGGGNETPRMGLPLVHERNPSCLHCTYRSHKLVGRAFELGRTDVLLGEWEIHVADSTSRKRQCYVG